MLSCDRFDPAGLSRALRPHEGRNEGRWHERAWWATFAIVLVASWWVRVHELARRPMHADEANQAVKTGVLLESGKYRFDPRDHHGPTLYYAALPIAWMRGQKTLAELDETTVRYVPVVAGTLSVGLLACLVLPLGRWTALGAAVLLGLSPPTVYYSRYFIQETMLVTFTLGAFLSVQQWCRTREWHWAVMGGGCIGLMLATKASAPFFLFAGAAAWIGLRGWDRPSRDAMVAAGVMVGIAVVVAAAFYASFGSNLRGMKDALESYGLMGGRVRGGAGHEKPWWYYFSLFGWQKNGGLVWQQWGFTVLAVIGMIVALTAKTRSLLAVMIYAALLFGGLSWTSYKTPWHVIHLVPPLAVLGVAGVAQLKRRWIGGGLVVLGVVSLIPQLRLVVFQRPADSRNPYAYVHSSPDVVKYRAVVDEALRNDRMGIVRVIGEEYWPFPWYLRGLDAVGYWARPPEQCDAAIVISTMTYADEVRGRLKGDYQERILGLRPGMWCVVFIPAE